MSPSNEQGMFKSFYCSFVRTHAWTTVIWLRAALRRAVPVIEDAATPAASVPPREPPAKQGQLLRTADDEREKAEARRLKLRATCRADDDSKCDKLAMLVTPLWGYCRNQQLLVSGPAWVSYVAVVRSRGDSFFFFLP
ncbi:uncharacterized protein LOC144164739 isoform X1 [Haemaphysalis longicornis]